MTFRIIFFTLFFSVLVIRGYYGWKQRRAGQSSGAVTKEAVEREGMWSIVFRFILFLYMVAVAIVFAINPPWLNLFAAPFPAWSRWTGVGLGVISVPLLIWVHHTLGRQWSTNLQLKQNHTLIAEGPYRWVRHPMYTALFDFFVGLALIPASWLIVILVVAAILVLYARIGKEEAMMTEQFGDEYRAYMQRTGRFLPRR
jgi:protein-S-isoprenylcysteine O-methyltransferase Ste14